MIIYKIVQLIHFGHSFMIIKYYYVSEVYMERFKPLIEYYKNIKNLSTDILSITLQTISIIYQKIIENNLIC